MYRIIVLAAIFSCLVHTGALGQAISIEYDLNVPAQSFSGSPTDPTYDAEKGFSLRVGFLSQGYSCSDARHRWSVFIGHQSLDTTWDSEPLVTTKHSANSFEIGHDWLVLDKSWAGASIGVSSGLVFARQNESNPEPCPTLSCGESALWGQVSLYAKAEFPLTANFGLMAGFRSWLISGSEGRMFPFERGPVFSVGIQMFGTPK